MGGQESLFYLVVAAGCTDGGDAVETTSGSLDAAETSLAEALDTTLPDGALTVPQPFYRIDLGARNDGTLELLGASRVLLKHAPVPGFLADHMLVSRASDGTILDAVPLSFPTAGHATAREGDQLVHAEFESEVSLATSFLPSGPDVDRIELVSPTMDVSLAISAADIMVVAAPAQGVDSSGAIPKLSAPDFQFLYEHIRQLKPGDESWLPRELLSGGSLLPISERAFSLIADGFENVMPIALNTARGIGVVHWSAGSDEAAKDVRGIAVGPYVLFSDVQLETPRLAEEEIQIVVHEAAHTFAFLTSVVSGPNTLSTSAWTAPVMEAASRVVRRYALTGGIETVWGRSDPDSHRPGCG